MLPLPAQAPNASEAAQEAARAIVRARHARLRAIGRVGCETCGQLATRLVEKDGAPLFRCAEHASVPFFATVSVIDQNAWTGMAETEFVGRVIGLVMAERASGDDWGVLTLEELLFAQVLFRRGCSAESVARRFLTAPRSCRETRTALALTSSEN